MYEGSCLCKTVKYVIKSEPVKTSHCHCTMCRKQHGSAFATYARVPASDLEYVSGVDALVSYNSSPSVIRKFCKYCGSNIEWNGNIPEWTSITIATLDTHYNPASIIDIFTDSKVSWLNHS